MSQDFIWIFWVPIWDWLAGLRCEEVMLGPPPACFPFLSPKLGRFLQPLLSPELSSAGAKPLEEADVSPGLM